MQSMKQAPQPASENAQAQTPKPQRSALRKGHQKRIAEHAAANKFAHGRRLKSA
jgi:hypothetical protein